MTRQEVSTRTLMVTAHARVRAAAGRRPRPRPGDCRSDVTLLFRVAHRAIIARWSTTATHPVVIGQRDHVEVRGLTEDLDRTSDVVPGTSNDFRRLGRPFLASRIAAQTTQPNRQSTASGSSSFDGNSPRPTSASWTRSCHPTKQRQERGRRDWPAVPTWLSSSAARAAPTP
jgi:hypothetical protein